MIAAGTRQGAVRVLIVDDNRDFAENVALLARSRGLDPAVAHDRAGALALAQGDPFDVAIVDQKLPDGVGTELLAELRKLLPDLVTMVVTAFVSLDNSLAALREGAFAFISKDSEPDELIETIARAAENARLRRENRTLRQRHDAILQAIPDFLLLVDGANDVESVNRRHPTLCPGELPAAIGRPLDEVIDPGLHARESLAHWITQVRRGEAPAERTLESTGADGALSILALRAVLLGRGATAPVLLRAAELTDRISLERRVAESEHLATLGRLVSSIAHDLRNPLAGIRALTQLVQRSSHATPRDAENLSEILGLTDRMHATLSDLLDFARPGSRRDEPLQVAELLGTLVVEARRWPAADGRTLDLDLAPEPAIVVGTRERVEGLVANLIDNALQAAPAGGRVHVALKRRDRRVEIAVEDDGPGIPADLLPRLFQPFVTTKTRGTGLGLSIAKKNAESLGGRIVVDRSPALGGARFRVTLPLSA